MSEAVELVRRHLQAVWDYDQAELQGTMAKAASLRLSHHQPIAFDWQVSNLYRYVSQAWDFAPEHIDLSEADDGVVHAKIRLTNGANWIKQVEARYHVDRGRIDAIDLFDNAPSLRD